MNTYEKLGAFERVGDNITHIVTTTEYPPKITKQNERGDNKTILNNNEMIDISPIGIIRLLHKSGKINNFLFADSKKRIRENKPLKNSVKIHYDYFLKTHKGSKSQQKKDLSIPIEVRGVSYRPKFHKDTYSEYMDFSGIDSKNPINQLSPIDYLKMNSDNIIKNAIDESKNQIDKTTNKARLTRYNSGVLLGATDSNKGANMETKPFYVVNKDKPQLCEKFPIDSDRLNQLCFCNTLINQNGVFVSGLFSTEKPKQNPINSNIMLISQIRGLIAQYDYKSISLIGGDFISNT